MKTTVGFRATTCKASAGRSICFGFVLVNVIMMLGPACSPIRRLLTSDRGTTYRPPQEMIDYPVIDIHSHTFNARYLPLRNIVRGRRIEFPELAHVSERVLLGFAGTLIRLTHLSHFDAESDAVEIPLARLEESAAREGTQVTPLQAITRSPDPIPETSRVRLAPVNETQAAEEVRPPQPATGSDLRQLVQLIMPEEQKVRADAPATETKGAGAKAAVRFLAFLTSSEGRIARELLKHEFKGRVRLFVHHMMDLGPVFGQSPQGTRFLDFKTQIRRAEALDRTMNGKFLHFVAWNPYRLPNDPTLSTPEPLRVVIDAAKRGAWGVKFYPPSGYRPDDNEVAPRPAAGVLREQWDARYSIGTIVSPEKANKRLNEINERLFAWAERNDVPIFSHSAGGEFNASKGYGKRNAHPKYWRKVLERHPHLRLCLAHAGGADFWFHRNLFGNGDWGREAYELCTLYPNVYCEFGAQDEILDQNKRDAFQRRITDYVEQSNTSRPYRFADKIMYGSDWFMPTNAAPRTLYLDSYREAFLTPSLRPVYKQFFCRNALQYLLLEKRLDQQANTTVAMRSELRKLIKDAAH